MTLNNTLFIFSTTAVIKIPEALFESVRKRSESSFSYEYPYILMFWKRSLKNITGKLLDHPRKLLKVRLEIVRSFSKLHGEKANIIRKFRKYIQTLLMFWIRQQRLSTLDPFCEHLLHGRLQHSLLRIVTYFRYPKEISSPTPLRDYLPAKNSTKPTRTSEFFDSIFFVLGYNFSNLSFLKQKIFLSQSCKFFS